MIYYRDRVKLKRIIWGISKYGEKFLPFKGRCSYLDDAIKELNEAIKSLDIALIDAIMDPESWRDSNENKNDQKFL